MEAIQSVQSYIPSRRDQFSVRMITELRGAFLERAYNPLLETEQLSIGWESQ